MKIFQKHFINLSIIIPVYCLITLFITKRLKIFKIKNYFFLLILFFPILYISKSFKYINLLTIIFHNFIKK